MRNPIIYCAIYARRSHEQRVSEEQKSVEGQITNSKKFAASRPGWAVLEDHIYTDDSVSGGELRRRVGRKKLLDLIMSGRAPFQVLIVRESSRLSRRDGEEAFGELKKIAKMGIEVWFYQDGTKFSYGTFGENVVGFVRAEMNAEYRRQISIWIRAAMRRKAEAGHVTGRIPYGYTAVVHRLASGERSHVTMVLDRDRSTIVARIFARALAGAGVQRIATELNTDNVPTISARSRYGWSKTAVRHILTNPIYKGLVEYGLRDFREGDGERRTVAVRRPDREVYRRVDESLRIVSDRDWRAVQDRLAAVTADLVARDGQHNRGGRQRDDDSRYLLTGHARCASCRSTMSVISWPGIGGGPRRYLYQCLNYHRAGSRYCSARAAVPIDLVDADILMRVGERLLLKVSVAEIVDAVFAEIDGRRASKQVQTWRKDLATLEGERAGLLAAVKASKGRGVDVLAAALDETVARIEDLKRSVADAETGGHAASVSRAEVTRLIKGKIDAWRGVLRRGRMEELRTLLREVLDGPIWMTATRETDKATGKTAHAFEFEGEVPPGIFFAGIAGLPMSGESLKVPSGVWKTKFRGKVVGPVAA